jgi:hypothetical protein
VDAGQHTDYLDDVGSARVQGSLRDGPGQFPGQVRDGRIQQRRGVAALRGGDQALAELID